MTDPTVTQLAPPPDRIDLGIGQPDPALLPASLFRDLTCPPDNLAYGAEIGDGRFLRALARWLEQHYGTAVEPEDLMVTNGSSNALDMICHRFARRGDTVLVEDPTYFLARRQLADHGLEAVAVPMDSGGVDPQQLEALIRHHQPAFFYTVPTFHNPTGVTQNVERRGQVTALARRYDCPVVADEVYQLLHYDRPPPPPLATFDREAPVLSIGSFSKILAPGLRLGWIQASPGLLAKLTSSALLASGGGLNPFAAGLVRPLLENGAADRHLATLRGTYARRRDRLADALRRHLGERARFTRPEGGYFIWCELPAGTDADALLGEARLQGAGYVPGARFSGSPAAAGALRLCFAYYDETALAEAARRLAASLDQ